MVDLFGTSLMSFSFLTDVASTFHKHTYTQSDCICIKYFNYGGHAEVMRINAVWKLIYFINGIFLWPALCQRGLDWEATSFLNCCASHCQGHCLSFSSLLSLSVIPRFSSSESRMQGFGRWVGLSHLASAEWNVCVCVYSSTYAGAWFSCSVNFGELIWFMTYLLSKRRTNI